MPPTGGPEYTDVLQPFVARVFGEGIGQSHAHIGPLALAVEGDGSVIASGGLTRGQLYRFPIDGGDVLDPGSLSRALRGVHTAYYLIHSMDGPGGFEAQDREAALNFARACRAAGVRRIIYLGGLGDGPGLSEHLASRQDVGRSPVAGDRLGAILFRKLLDDHTAHHLKVEQRTV